MVSKLKQKIENGMGDVGELPFKESRKIINGNLIHKSNFGTAFATKL
jgi:hypothetical protein